MGEGDNFLGVIKDLEVKVIDYIIIIYTFITNILNPKYKLILGGLY